jgi:hypothetical protein
MNYIETNNLTLSLTNNSLPISPATNLSFAFPIPPQKNEVRGVWNVTGAVSTDTSYVTDTHFSVLPLTIARKVHLSKLCHLKSRC